MPTATPEPVRTLSDFLPAGTFTLSLNLFPWAVRALGLSIYGADNEIVSLEETKDAFLLSAGRYGHGVGMPQWGAYGMAEEGKKAEEIVRYYFHDVTVEKLW